MPAISVSSVLMTVEEYLAAEERSEVKHEYLGGWPYAMAGGTPTHNAIALNLAGAIRPQLRGKNCRHFGMDVKLALQRGADRYFYYPDGMIVCGTSRVKPAGCEEPTVVFEVISESTRNIDEREKRSAYLAISNLDTYVRVEQDQCLVLIERRTATGWETETLTDLDAVLRLPTLGVEVPVAVIYEEVEFST